MTVTTEILLQPPIGPVEVDEGAARRALRDQIARLESDLAELVVSAWPGREPARTRPRAPRLLTLGGL